jgi:hypothetical protein
VAVESIEGRDPGTPVWIVFRGEPTFTTSSGDFTQLVRNGYTAGIQRADIDPPQRRLVMRIAKPSWVVHQGDGE